MRVTLLGTGSADGWPNPFCRCASCEAERADGRARTPSSALIDDVILIDCGPTTPHLPGGSAPWDRLEHLVLTHGHPDHLHPAVLLTRHWTGPADTLHVWGPAGAIDLCRDWVAPGAPVEFHVLCGGDSATVETGIGTYELRAHAARHAHGNGDALAEEALIYVLTAGDGTRLLYATDTGPVTAAELDLLPEPLDLVLIDETFGDHVDHGTGHLDLARLPGMLDGLRAAGAITGRTRVVATHLSHHNPPTRILRSRLAGIGVEVHDDGTVLDSARAPRLGHRRLILGGARSGKSAYAERLAGSAGPVTYVATGGARADDEEWTERVRRHRERRPDAWITVESADVAGTLTGQEGDGTVLVDCLALWLTAVLDDLDAWERLENGDRIGVEAQVHRRIDHLCQAIDECPASAIFVSNEVGMGVVPPTPSGRLFQDLLGLLNSRVADAVDEVTLMVAGRPLILPSDRTSSASTAWGAHSG